jgi:hypothetical protein
VKNEDNDTDASRFAGLHVGRLKSTISVISTVGRVHQLRASVSVGCLEGVGK